MTFCFIVVFLFHVFWVSLYVLVTTEFQPEIYEFASVKIAKDVINNFSVLIKKFLSKMCQSISTSHLHLSPRKCAIVQVRTCRCTHQRKIFDISLKFYGKSYENKKYFLL